MGGEQLEKTKTSKKISPPTIARKRSGDEKDFVDDKLSSHPLHSSLLHSSKRARRNWSLFSSRLQKVINGSSQITHCFVDLKLFTISLLSQNYISITPSSYFSNSFYFSPLIAFVPKQNVTLKKLVDGFDNTGNVRIWPASEAIAHLIITKQIDLSNCQNVLEIGAGFMGLTGFIAAKLYKNCQVSITDGNIESVQNLIKIRNLNRDLEENVKIDQLIWGTNELNTKFDVIFAADCIFFKECHENIRKCLESHLNDNGIIYISSPKRKGSLKQFEEYISDYFEIMYIEDINNELELYWNIDIDENLPELMAAVQLSVLKTSDDVCQIVGERNGQNLKFNEEVISRVSALVWDTVVDTWVDDLAAFSNHASRQQVNLDDIAMLTRRNSELFQQVREMTSLGKSNIATITNTNNPTKSRKRKSVEPKVEVIEKEKSSSPEVILAKTPTPCSFLKTPTVKRMTSTPKVGSNIARAELFVTPIRSSNEKENGEELEKEDVFQMTKIEEENEEEEDSFDKIFASHVASTSSKPNMSSLIRMAEENPLPGENTLLEIEERDRIQEPVEEKQEEYDSFDDDIIVENVKAVAKNHTTIKNGTKSPDLFADSSGSNNSTLKNKETSSTIDKSNTVFSKKLTTFNFDEDSMDAPRKTQKSPEVFDIDDEDSFDAPIPNVPIPNKSEQRNTPKFIDIDEDSFDAPVKAPKAENQSQVGQETPKNVPIPKWRVTKEKWANMKSTSSPSSSQTSQKSTTKTTPKRNNLSMNNDSFDEFDFDV
ncbi:unnamed protein product [Caenorhabditis angaria]|uniref:Calmodulin-lysine N-methyltransferase n=1 Tax=Caenorhabditis angaria TaxID=860376 RepID=A0A9P1IC18_9PELO|nr:unnamed protein product [Caenorhabditis angaria]